MGAALALAKAGIKSHVWESASALGEVGAGINITPNLSRILERWGVLHIAQNEAVALDGASVLSKHTKTHQQGRIKNSKAMTQTMTVMRL